MNTAAEGGFYARQVVRLSQGKGIDLKMSALNGSIFFLTHEFKKSMINRFG